MDCRRAERRLIQHPSVSRWWAVRVALRWKETNGPELGSKGQQLS